MDDDLTATVHSALTALDPAKKAQFLLDTALSLIDAGRYGQDVEKYLDVYLKTPDLPKARVTQALLARANARKAAGDALLSQAHQDFQSVLRLDPSNRQVANQIRRRTIRFAHDPPSHRAPLEVWSRIANYIPRYHLRAWLHLSSFHRCIALQHIFHSIDLYFGEDQPENVNRSLDIFDRVKSDRSFALLVKCLRVHWSYEEGELLDIMVRVFRTALPEFIALKEFEWIGYPELRQDMVQSLLSSHPRLVAFGSIGFHFDACGISAFKTLQKLTLRAEDDDGYADWSEITTVLNNNSSTLTHLILGAYLLRQHSWDSSFSSPAIHNLTHLDLVDTRISHLVLSRIANAAGGVNGRLESLTLHGIMEEPGKAAVIFGSDEVVGPDSRHSLFPRLKSFRFLLVGQPQLINNPTSPSQHPQEHYDPTILQLYQTIAHFLKNRPHIRRLDLGNCPWEIVAPILPGLKGLRVLGVRIGCSVRGCGNSVGGSKEVVRDEAYTSEIDALVQSIPAEMAAVRVEVGTSELPLHVYANQFQKFKSLSFLHLQLNNTQLTYHALPPTPPSSLIPQSLRDFTQKFSADHQAHLVRQYHARIRGPGPVYQQFPPQAASSSSSSASVLKRRSNGALAASSSKTRDGVVEDSGSGGATTTTTAPNAPNLDIDDPRPSQSPQQPPLPIAPLQPLNTLESAKHIATVVDSLDFVGWNGELYVIVRGEAEVKRGRGGEGGENRGVKKVDAAAGTMDTPSPVSILSSVSSLSSTPQPVNTAPQSQLPPPSSSSLASLASSPRMSHTPNFPAMMMVRTIELKELPSGRRLDCAKGVDLGNGDGVWLERRDVPIDYDMPVGGD